MSSKIEAYTNQEFIEVVSHKFRMKCKREGIDPSHENFMKYLMGCRIVDEKTAWKYMIIESYPEELYRCDCVKTKAVLNLEDRYPYQERTIWNIIGGLSLRFRYSNGIKFLRRPNRRGKP